MTTESRAQVIAAIGVLSSVSQSSLFEAPARTEKAFLRNLILGKYLKREAQLHWTLIESIVVFDDVLYDGYAFGRHRLDREGTKRLASLEGHGLVRATWDIGAYKKTEASLAFLRGWLGKEGLVAARTLPADRSEAYAHGNDAFWDGAEKNYHDDLSESPVARFSFADSDDSFERAFFYAELASTLGVSLLPRPSTSGALLERLGLAYSRGAHALIKDTLGDFDKRLIPAQISIEFPPLARKIAWLSLDQGRAPVEVAKEMRASKTAESYRRHLAHLDAELRDKCNPRSVNALLKDFKNIVAKWSEELAPREGVEYQTRNLKVQLLPAAAAVADYLATMDVDHSLKAAGAAAILASFWEVFGDSVAIKDPILWGGKKYLAFVAEWYELKP